MNRTNVINHQFKIIRTNNQYHTLIFTENVKKNKLLNTTDFWNSTEIIRQLHNTFMGRQWIIITDF